MKNSKIFKLSLAVMLLLFASCEKSEMDGIKFLLNRHDAEAYTINYPDIEYLPQPVQNYLITTGVVGSQSTNSIKLNYTGNFKLNENSEWASMEAVTYVTVEPISRNWIGEINSPMGKMTGLDYYYNGNGKLDIRLAPSVPFMFSDGYELSVSELIAFLGELVYNPSACLNDNIQWEEVSDYAVKATLEDAGLSVSGIFYFDENYLITRFESNDRYFGDTKNKLPWMVYVQDYKKFNGIKIPTTFRALWIKPEGEYEYIISIGISNAVTSTIANGISNDFNTVNYSYLIIPNIGYRYQKPEKHKLFAGIGYSPIISYDGLSIENRFFQFKNHFYLSIGLNL